MRVPVPTEILPATALGRVHFVGVGGAALSGLARIMSARGVTVSGSDEKDSATLVSLRETGVTCWVGHDPRHVQDADTVVVSTAVRADNLEVVAAYESGIRVYPRSAAVQSVLIGRTAIVVTGTHGKTTTTSMLATALLSCGADPSYAIGSTLNASGLNAAEGSGPVFVAEGDESDEAILVYTPSGAIVIGAVAGVLCALAVGLKYRFGYDDSLDVVGVHLVGGIVGTVGVGFVGTAIASAGVDGLLYGGGVDQLWRQAVGAGAVLAYSFVLTFVIGYALQRTIGFRVDEDDEASGLDSVVHGETAYDLHQTFGGVRTPGAAIATDRATAPAGADKKESVEA